MSLTIDRIELAQVIKQALEISRPLIDARRQSLTVGVPDEPIWVEADSERLTQVVVNLLNNSAKYTDPGGRVWLTIEQDEDRAIVRVRDNGIGINREMLPRVFDLYAQSQRTLGHSQGGLGIGLHLVRSLTEMHGGTVEVYSEGIGKGSEFVVRLPLASPCDDRRPRASKDVEAVH